MEDKQPTLAKASVGILGRLHLSQNLTKKGGQIRTISKSIPSFEQNQESMMSTSLDRWNTMALHQLRN